MRSPLLLIILLAATGACSQSLAPDMTGKGGAATGSGGTFGAGGSGGSPNPGSGGANTTACDTLSANYKSALVAAGSCQVGASGQCQQIASSSLSACNCPTYVTNTGALTMLQSAWEAIGCQPVTPPCGILCPAPLNTTCVSVDGGSAGVCSYAPGTGGTSGNSGTGGAGGSSTDGGLGVCRTLASEYAAAVIAAKSCAAGASGQCAQPLPASLSTCPICTTYVTDRTGPDAVRTKWDAAGCGNTVTLCIGVSCAAAASGMCVPSDAGGSGCSDVYQLR
jgi:hypothetical protein